MRFAGRELMETERVAKTEVWKSPMPYLMGGIGALLLLIGIALILLGLSSFLKKWKQRKLMMKEGGKDLQSEDRRGEKTIVNVIMAGQDQPTCGATPAVLPSSQNIPAIQSSGVAAKESASVRQ